MEQNLTEIKRQASRRGPMAYYSIQMQRDAVKLALDEWKAKASADEAPDSHEEPKRFVIGVFRKPKVA